VRHIIGLCLLIALMVGCINPPVGTVIVTDPANGSALAYDKDKNGVADLIPLTRDVVDPVTGATIKEIVLGDDGQPVMVVDLVPGSGVYKGGAAVDSIAPTVLTGLGPFLPGGVGAILIGLGWAWRAGKFGRIFANTVMSIQIARQRLKDGGYEEALKLLDESVENGQLQATIDQIAKIKAQMGLGSVTGKDVPVE